MKVSYSRRYLRDFYVIMDYLEALNPAAASRVSGEIDAAIDQLIHFPSSGQATNYGTTRRLVTKRYGYLIYYSVNTASEIVQIQTVTHGRQQRPFDDV